MLRIRGLSQVELEGASGLSNPEQRGLEKNILSDLSVVIRVNPQHPRESA